MPLAAGVLLAHNGKVMVYSAYLTLISPKNLRFWYAPPIPKTTVFREISSAPHPERAILLKCPFLGVGQNHPQSGGMQFFDPRAILLYDAMNMEG